MSLYFYDYLIVYFFCDKRKKKLAHRVSIYNPKGNLFHPGETSFKPDNGSHVYDSIDETMTYSHLIGDSGYNGAETGSYRPFTSPVDVKPPIIEVPENNKKEEFSTFLDPAESFGPPRPRTPLGPMKSLGFEDRRLVDNELCTFKNSGDPNPIRLSDPDPLPPPLLDDDWDNDYDNDEDYIWGEWTRPGRHHAARWTAVFSVGLGHAPVRIARTRMGGRTEQRNFKAWLSGGIPCVCVDVFVPQRGIRVHTTSRQQDNEPCHFTKCF